MVSSVHFELNSPNPDNFITTLSKEDNNLINVSIPKGITLDSVDIDRANFYAHCQKV